MNNNSCDGIATIDKDYFAQVEEELGDKDFMLEMVTMFIEQMDEKISELEQAVEKQDTESLRAIAHGLKGTAGNMGVACLASISKEIEFAVKEQRLDDVGSVLARLKTESELVRTELAAL